MWWKRINILLHNFHQIIFQRNKTTKFKFSLIAKLIIIIR